MPRPASIIESVTIRQIEPSDAEEVARLSAEFGYPVTPEVIEQRIRDLGSLQNHAVYVASLGGQVVGWIDIGIVHHLQADPYGEIGGLVVNKNLRGHAIGAHLVSRAEQWTLEHGVSKALVRSQVAREAAHRFYLRQGYAQTKTSNVFTKSLRL